MLVLALARLGGGVALMLARLLAVVVAGVAEFRLRLAPMGGRRRVAPSLVSVARWAGVREDMDRGE